MQAALAESEREHLGRVASAWEQLESLLGYRLRPELGATFGDLAALLNATQDRQCQAGPGDPSSARCSSEQRPVVRTLSAGRRRLTAFWSTVPSRKSS